MTTIDKNNWPGRNYPAKLLLFGEYSVLVDQTALAVPYGKYHARWEKTIRESSNTQKEILDNFIDYLKLVIKGNEKFFLDLDQMERWFKSGLRLDSNIPTGCGLGSSGAFCAAVMDAFGIVKNDDLHALQHQFALMESFFHGKSSGLDPLVSYLNRPILIRAGELPHLKSNYHSSQPTFGVSLLDTKIQRSTAPLVSIFQQNLYSKEYSNKFEKTYLPQVNSAIRAYSDQDWEKLWHSCLLISELQFGLFNEMIPDNLKSIWKKGIQSDRYFMKLCGAGGGGFYYIFHRESEPCSELIPTSSPIGSYFFGLSADK
ncbi:MAG: hypothetical protein EA409_10470 [Saprospirales bacterium]|nr:MAG: hypothetical protein EA409_10470 [Saprospirales bacterium]